MPHLIQKYSLQLNKQINWTIIGIDDAITWLQRFASILKLSPTNLISDNCIFVIKNHILSCSVPLAQLPPNLSKPLPKTGWSNRDLKHCQIWSHKSKKWHIFEIKPSRHQSLNIIRMCSLMDIIHLQVISIGGFPIHSALVQKKSHGVIIAAHGGTGKSTCCRRIPFPWEGVCDDEVLIVKGKNGHWFAHPCPTWSNFLMQRRKRPTWPIKKEVPVVAFCFLKQAKKDRITFIGRGQAAVAINQFATQIMQRGFRNIDKLEESRLRHKIFENACHAAQSVPVYILEAHKNGKFWEEIEKVLAIA